MVSRKNKSRRRKTMKIRKRMGGMMNNSEIEKKRQMNIIQKQLNEGKTMQEIIDEATYSTEGGKFKSLNKPMNKQTIQEILNGAAHNREGTYKPLNTPMNKQTIQEILNGAAHSRVGTYEPLNKPKPKSKK